MPRKGEKLGWTIGWIGGSVFLLIGGVLWLVFGNISAGIAALVCYGLLAAFTLTFAPWKFPNTKYWKLLLPNYLCLFTGSVLALVLGFPGEDLSGQWHNLFFLFALLTPFFTMGRRTWNDNTVNKV